MEVIRANEVEKFFFEAMFKLLSELEIFNISPINLCV
jgi:hypothetical protein